jgi:hypothetical protein
MILSRGDLKNFNTGIAFCEGGRDGILFTSTLSNSSVPCNEKYYHKIKLVVWLIFIH